MFISISLTKDKYYVANLFDIVLYNNLSSEKIEQLCHIVEHLVSTFHSTSHFDWANAVSHLCSVIGENGHIETDKNLTCRSSDDLNRLMENLIINDLYSGPCFTISNGNLTKDVYLDDEGSYEELQLLF